MLAGRAGKKPTSDFPGQVHVTLLKFGGLVEWARKLSLSSNLVRPSLHDQWLLFTRVESLQRVLKIHTLHQPRLSVCNSVWFGSRLTWASLSNNEKLKTYGLERCHKNLESTMGWWEVLMYKKNGRNNKVV